MGLAVLVGAPACTAPEAFTLVAPAQPSLVLSDDDLRVEPPGGPPLRIVWAVDRVQLDGVWREAADRVTLHVVAVDGGARLLPTVTAVQAGRVGGVQLRLQLQGTPQQPRWMQFGYGKWTAAGVAKISAPLALDSDGVAVARLATPQASFDPLVSALDPDPQVGWWTTTIALSPTAPVVGIGACSADRLQTRLAVGLDDAGVDVAVVVGGNGSAIAVTATESVTLESVCVVAAADAHAVQTLQIAAFTPHWTPPPGAAALANTDAAAASAPRFYSTWHADFEAVTLAKIRRHMDALTANGLNASLDAFQVDDGYQAAWGDWLATAPGFGATVTELAATLRAGGYRPGLWLAPSLVAADSAVARAHPEWILRRDGVPVACDTCNTRGIELWALDFSHPQVVTWLRDVIVRLQDAGFELFKIDFLAMAAAVGDAYDPGSTALDRYHAMLGAVRAGLRPTTIVWSATYPLLPTLGALHGYRLAADLGFPWFDDMPVAAWYQHARALAVRGPWLSAFGWIDPDGFFVRGHPPERVQTMTWLDAMVGGMYSLGERDDELRPELAPTALPAPLRDTIGTRRPFLPLAPLMAVVEPWTLLGSQEAILGYDTWVDAQPAVWLRRDDRGGATLIVINWSPVRRTLRVDLRAAAPLLATGRYALYAADGAAIAVTDQQFELTLDGLGSALLTLHKVP